VKTTERTLSYGSNEKFNRAMSDFGIFITQCTSNCGDNLRIKYVVPKALCEYFGVNIP